MDNDFNNNQAGKTVLAMQKFLSSSNIFIHTGDIACADLYGLVVYLKPYDDTWNTFQNNIQPISAYIPYTKWVLETTKQHAFNTVMMCVLFFYGTLQHIQIDFACLVNSVEDTRICGIRLIMVRFM